MPNVSANIDTFLRSADNAAARTNLGVLPLTGGALTGTLQIVSGDLESNLNANEFSFINYTDPENTYVARLLPGTTGNKDISLPASTGTLALQTNDPSVTISGTFSWSEVPSSNSLTLRRAALRTLQLGTNATSGTAPAHTIKGPNGTAGQSNQAGGNLTISSGLSTGSGAASVIIATSGNTAGSTTLNTAVTRFTANASGVAIGANGTPSAFIKHGTATLVAGTVTISEPSISLTSLIFVNRFTDGGTIGDSYSVTRNNTVGFTITSKTANITAALDTSTVAYLIIQP